MTKEEISIFLNGLDDTQKAEVEKIFQKKRNQLFEWENAERKKVCEKLKAEGRYISVGLDSNNTQPEIRELSAEYHRRFNALPEESIFEFLQIQGKEI